MNAQGSHPDVTIKNSANKKRYSAKAAILSNLLLCALLISLAGCTAGPDYKKPDMTMGQYWPQDSSDTFSLAAEPNNQNWWKIFNDPELDKIIEQALKNSPDIRIALHRLEAARALRDFNTGQYYPNVNAFGSYSHFKDSPNGRVLTSSTEPTDLFSGGLDFIWEIDLFGRIKRTVESSQASYEASIEDYRNVMVTLLSDVCNNYIDYRTTQARIVYAKSNADSQRETLKLTQDRYNLGLAGELDVRQAEFNLANTESTIPVFLIAEEIYRNRLAVLQGLMPGELKAQLGTFVEQPSIDPNISVALPADLLRWRPDIRSAERRLAAQTAQIGVATADLYPSLHLTGNIQIDSQKFSGLGNSSNKAYAIGPDVRLNIFDGNRIRNNIRIQEADTLQALVIWENTVLLAAEDVRNSITGYTQENLRKGYLETSVKSAMRSTELVKNLYTNGLTNFQNVLDTERTLFVQQDNLASSQGAVSKDMVRIYKAFGAGWDSVYIWQTQDKLPVISK